MYTEEQKQAARQELARRELARRGQTSQSMEDDNEEIPYISPPARTGFGGILEDVGDIPGKVLDYGMGVPGKAMQSWEQIFNHPGRAIKNVIAGGGETLEAPINLLGAIGPYFKEKQIPGLGALPGFHVPNLGIEKKMGLEGTQPGDELLRQMMMFAPGRLVKIPGLNTIGKRVKSMSEHGPLTKKLEELETKHREATTKHAEDLQNFNALKEHLESLPGFESSKHSALKRKAAEAGIKIESMRKQSESTPEYLRVSEEPEAPEKTLTSLVEPVKHEKIDINAIKKPAISEGPIERAENLLRTHEQKSAELEKNFGEKHLLRGYTHDVPIADHVANTIEGIKNPKTGKFEGGRKQEIGNIYNNVEKDLSEQHVLIPNDQRLINAESDMRNLMEKSRGHFKNDEEFEATVKRLAQKELEGKGPSHDIVPAADVLKNFRSMRHLSQKLRKEAYSSKVAGNKDLQSEILSKAEDFDMHAHNLETLLENHDLGPSLSKLKTANKRWREEIVPLYKNKTYQQFLKGTGPDNIMKSLRGNGPGQQIIRDIIKSEPHLLRNIVGQRYAHSPEKLHEFNELTHEYTQHMPEVQEFRNQHFASKQAESQAKMQLEQAKHEHQLQKERTDIAHKQQIEQAKAQNAKTKEDASEQTRLKKVEIDKENKLNQKEHAEKVKYFKTQQEIKSLEDKHAKLLDHAEKLKKKSKAEKMSLKEKLELESQRDKTKKDLDKISKDIKLRNRLLKLGGYATASIIFGGPAYNVISSKLGLKSD